MTTGPGLDSLQAQRYGRRPSDPARRARWSRIGTALALVIAVVLVGLAAWGRSRGEVTFTDLGIQEGSASVGQVTMSFRVEAPPGAAALCTVRAVNSRLTEVGRIDVEVPPSESGGSTMTVTIQTVERADGAGVKSCVRR